MKMTVLDIPARELERHQDRLTRAIEAETRFGVGASFKNRRQHEVLDADWNVSPVTRQNKDRAWLQLGTTAVAIILSSSACSPLTGKSMDSPHAYSGGCRTLIPISVGQRSDFCRTPFRFISDSVPG